MKKLTVYVTELNEVYGWDGYYGSQINSIAMKVSMEKPSIEDCQKWAASIYSKYNPDSGDFFFAVTEKEVFTSILDE